MRIGFDAKRAFHNTTGLGNYARTLLISLAKQFPQHDYMAYTPKPGTPFYNPSLPIVQQHPEGLLGTWFPAWWRSFGISKRLKQEVDLYHGLSNELPFGIDRKKIPTVVSIHDVIYEDRPQDYGLIDRLMYRTKTRYACLLAKHIVAISEATRERIIAHYPIPPEKISVIYQAADPRFYIPFHEAECNRVRLKYRLKENYLIVVGSIIPRKNLLNVCKAFLHTDQDLELVVVGKGKSYKEQVLHFLKEYHLVHRVHFLEDQYASEDVYMDLPYLYQASCASVYLSRMEGFGIPVLEAMASGTPVITSTVSSLYELGKNHACCADPDDIPAITSYMQEVHRNPSFRNEWIEKGKRFSGEFTPERFAGQWMNLYEQLVSE